MKHRTIFLTLGLAVPLLFVGCNRKPENKAAEETSAPQQENASEAAKPSLITDEMKKQAASALGDILKSPEVTSAVKKQAGAAADEAAKRMRAQIRAEEQRLEARAKQVYKEGSEQAKRDYEAAVKQLELQKKDYREKYGELPK